ncbi:protein phosphatase 2, regulatory subunit B (B56), alpha isoform [Mus musculus]|nr:protein phosphatase 2, regulatory subunit B (B56), alpha isoform [Mus musculus]
MSSPSPPAPVACAAISASEKVDGFTRKSVRKAQRQKRSQGSSQFRSQGSQAELHPLPQLKMPLQMNSKSFSARSYNSAVYCLISWTLSQT